MCQSQTVILLLKIILPDVIAFQASIEILMLETPHLGFLLGVVAVMLTRELPE